MGFSRRERGTGWAWTFFTVWIGQALSLVGSRAGGFALVWWLTQRTGSGTVLATASMVALLPSVQRTGPRSVRCVLPTMPDANKLISAMNRLVV